MIVTMLWHGGSSYAVPTDEDAERFASLKEAKEEFWRRADYDPYYPCVENPEAWIFIGRTVGEYPDRIMRLGKRGAVVVERA